MNKKTAGLSDRGGRTINDDTVRIREDKGGIRVYVGDGLGGYAGGKQASEAAGEALFAIRGSMQTDAQLISAAAQAEQAVRRVQTKTQGNMKTTLVFLTVEKGAARWMHIGDSRLYHFREGRLVKQTADHSVSQMAVMMGDITPDQIRFHEDRNRVLRALGGDNARPELSPVTPVSAGKDAFLLCTDGFWEYVYEPEMEQALRAASSPQDWLDRMEKLLKSRVTGENDNYTAAAVIC